jgi:signal transduction histidine kinase/ActR/RegA family two-component response regulator
MAAPGPGLAVIGEEDLKVKWADALFLQMLDMKAPQPYEEIDALSALGGSPLVQTARQVFNTGQPRAFNANVGSKSLHVRLEPFICGSSKDILLRLFDIPRIAEEAAASSKFESMEKRIAERTQSLVNYQEELQNMARELVLAEQRERRRVSIELHDYLAQILVACRMKLESIKKQVRSKRTIEKMNEVKELLDESLAYTRTLIAELSPTVLYEAGLIAAIHWLAEQMQRRGLSVEVEHDGPECNLSQDESIMVFQSVRELLLNSIKHAETKAARVQIQCEPRALSVIVSDLGKGFEMGDGIPGPSASGKYGLFSIRERLQAMGGMFFLQSAPGQGTRATLIIPLRRRDAEPALPLVAESGPRPPYNQEQKQGIIRVLLVDDHEMIRKALRNLLVNYSDLAVIGEAADGEEAIAMARNLRPDAILMDVNMPKINGIEATRRIKKMLSGIVIVGLSVYDDREVAESMLEAGAAAYLSKGSAPEEIYRTLRSARAYEQMYFAE